MPKAKTKMKNAKSDKLSTSSAPEARKLSGDSNFDGNFIPNPLKRDSFPVKYDTKGLLFLTNKASKTSFRTQFSDSDVTCHVVPSDFLLPQGPLRGENPNDLLVRLYAMWPDQHSASYRPHAHLNPEATAEHNQLLLREWFDAKQKRPKSFKETAAKISNVTAAMMHLETKSVGLSASVGSTSRKVSRANGRGREGGVPNPSVL